MSNYKNERPLLNENHSKVKSKFQFNSKYERRLIELNNALKNRKLSLKDYLFAVAIMILNELSSYHSIMAQIVVGIVESLEVDDYDKEDDFNFDSLVIVSSTKISHYNITSSIKISRIFIN